MVKNPPANAGDTRDESSIPGMGRSPGAGNGNPTSVFLPGESHGQRSLHKLPVLHPDFLTLSLINYFKINICPRTKFKWHGNRREVGRA